MFSKIASLVENILPSNIAEGVSVAIGINKDARHVDRTYYCLVPNLLEPTGFTLHTVRALPVGVAGAAPKSERIFLVPSAASLDGLRAALHKEAVDATTVELGQGDGLTEFLQQTANQIDQTQSTVTKGLLIVGGLVALANPVTGVGLLASSLIPKAGGDALTAGIRTIGGRLKRRIRDRARSRAKTNADDAYAAALPSVRESPLLQRVGAMLDGHVDADERDATAVLFENGGELHRNVAAQAIAHVYGPIIENRKKAAECGLSRDTRAWLNRLVVEATEAEEISSEAASAALRIRALREHVQDGGISGALADLERRVINSPACVRNDRALCVFLNTQLSMLEKAVTESLLADESADLIARNLRALASADAVTSDELLRVLVSLTA